MKRTILKRLAALGLALGMVLQSSIPAAAEEDRETYARFFEEVMRRIEQDYTGSFSRAELFEAAMKGMFGRLDEYSEFFDREQTYQFEQSINKSFQGIGIQFRRENDNYVVIKLIAGGSAGENGIMVGDILLFAGGVSLKELSTEEVVSKITGEKGTYVDITVQRGQEKLNFHLQRRALHLPTAEQIKLTDLTIALPQGLKPEELLYVSLNSFGTDTAKELKKIMENPANATAKILLLDLRDNGGGYVDSVIEIGNMLLPEGKIVTFKDKQGEEEVYYSKLEKAPYRKVIALINQNTASAAEILAGALKDSGIGILVGEKTFGKGVAQEILGLNGGEYSFKLTYKEFFTPAGHSVQKVGIYPDILEETPDYIISDRRFFIGDDHPAIYQVENILHYLGYLPETPDTKYEAATMTAVLAFQRAGGLGEHTVIDFTTQGALNHALRKAISEKDRVLNKAIEESGKILLTDGK
ncbi:PDZ domain-containing protein [Clostridiales bacterium COT073_COT-073]|nr:PDZ domain-containing protein [Clostridiales bacterium COT073_COT-073]